MDTTDKTQFQNPSSIYRTAPLWVWNDIMDTQEIRKQLQELKSHGFGGAFVHPRPGLVTEYLSEEWFDRWRDALEEAKKLDMKLYIYDENSYPSGFAGGHVPSQLPDCLGNAIVFRKMDAADWEKESRNSSPMLNRPGHPVKAFAYEEGPSGQYHITHDLTQIPSQEWPKYGSQYLIFEFGSEETNAWLGGFSYVDLMRPEVTQTFLSVTYEAYKARFGDSFGTDIPAVFTDEPYVSAGGVYHSDQNALPYSYWFAHEFEKRNGYDLNDHLACLFVDARGDTIQVDAPKVRYDYYCTIRDLWEQNFVLPLSKWCEENNIALTGHYLEHQWPYPWGNASPAIMSLYEHMQWPAIDMLMTYLLKKDGTDPLLLTIREVLSAANQFDKERVLCETYGAGGWDSTFEDYKRIGDWLYVHGINFMNQHLTFSTIMGARKRDHPQSFDWRQPWWDEYTDMADYYGRLSYVLSQGKNRNRILLLHPTTSAFLQSPYSENANLFRGEFATEEKTELEKYVDLIQWLSDQQWDFDLGDEFIMERHGSIEDGKYRVAKRSYDLVIVPGAMEHMKQSTVDLLQAFMAAGGKVIALGKPGTWVEGQQSNAIASLAQSPGWIEAANTEELHTFLARQLTRFVNPEEDVLPKGVASLRREFPDGSAFYFFTNSNPEPLGTHVRIKGTHAEIWDPWTGEILPCPYETVGEDLRIPMDLAGSGSLLIKVLNEKPDGLADGADAGHGKETSLTYRPIPGTALEAEAENENVYPIYYCDVKIGSKEYRQVHTIQAGILVFQHYGFNWNPWDNAVQFKRRLLDRNYFEDEEGFEVSYGFSIAPGVSPESLKLFAEHNQYYQLQVNGHPVAWDEDLTWLDHHIGGADITPFVREGENTVTLTAPTFDVLLEVEPVFLRGSFSVTNAEDRWTLDAPRPLDLGPWTDQGYPFYGDAVTYRRTFSLGEDHGPVRLRLKEWEGTVITVMVNGQKAGLLGIDKDNTLDISSQVRPGTNEILLRVCGSFKNLLGPHNDPSKPRRTAWPGNWKKGPMLSPPPASKYDLIHYGLLEDFIIEEGSTKL